MQNFCEELYKGSNHCPNEFSTATAQHSSSALSLISVVILATFTIRRISWKLMENCAARGKKFSSDFTRTSVLDGYIFGVLGFSPFSQFQVSVDCFNVSNAPPLG